MKKKRVTKEPYEGYTLPKSAEKGGAFIDFNKVVSSIYPDLGKQPVRKIKKRKRKRK